MKRSLADENPASSVLASGGMRYQWLRDHGMHYYHEYPPLSHPLPIKPTIQRTHPDTPKNTHKQKPATAQHSTVSSMETKEAKCILYGCRLYAVRTSRSHLRATLDQHFRGPLDEQPVTRLVSARAAQDRHGLAISATKRTTRGDRCGES